MRCEEAKRLQQLEDENDRLKRLVADLSLDNQMLKHLAEGNWSRLVLQGNARRSLAPRQQAGSNRRLSQLDRRCRAESAAGSSQCGQ